MALVSWDSDGRAAERIGERLGEFGTVGGNVPLGYESYVSIPNSADPGYASDGTIDLSDGPERLEQLLDVLLPPGTEQTLHCALWNGYGFLYDHGTDPNASRGSGMLASVSGEPMPVQHDRLVERAEQVHLSLPHRDHHLWSGPREVASALLDHLQSPTIMFPADRSWFLNSDLDSARTEIGGPAALLAPLLTPAWGGRPVEVTDPITAAWDTHPQ